MSVDLLSETPLPLSAVARTIPGARGADRISPTTVWRWCRKGTKTVDGRVVRLEHYRIGSRVMTTTQAVARYVAALSTSNSNDPAASSETRTPTERRKASERAEAELIAAGA